MREQEFLTIQHQILALAPIVAEMDLVEFIDTIEQADTIGPMLAPSLWMRKHEDMDRIRQLAEALLPFRRAVLKMREEARDAGR